MALIGFDHRDRTPLTQHGHARQASRGSRARGAASEAPTTERITAQLAAADKAVAEDLFEPADDNALVLYRKVLDEDRTNRRARSGLAAVQDRLIEEIGAALDDGDSDEAERILTGLDQVPHEGARFAGLRARPGLAREVEPLLASAAELLRQGKGLEPAGGSALDVYRKVRELDPGNALAQQGLEQRSVLERALAAGQGRLQGRRRDPGRGRGDRAGLAATARHAHAHRRRAPPAAPKPCWRRRGRRWTRAMRTWPNALPSRPRASAPTCPASTNSRRACATPGSTRA